MERQLLTTPKRPTTVGSALLTRRRDAATEPGAGHHGNSCGSHLEHDGRPLRQPLPHIRLVTQASFHYGGTIFNILSIASGSKNGASQP